MLLDVLGRTRTTLTQKTSSPSLASPAQKWVGNLQACAVLGIDDCNYLP